LFDSTPEDIPGAVELHIVERTTGEVVASMRASEDASGLANLISADLDRLGAEEFATEWGIRSAGSTSTS
jgi:hypothetical protein